MDARREGTARGMGLAHQMIFLDTNFLIGVLQAGTPEDQHSRRWLAGGESLGASVIVWAEFHCGPVTAAQLQYARSLIGRPEHVTEPDAERAAELLNATGRR